MIRFEIRNKVALITSALVLSLTLVIPGGAVAQTRAQTSIITQLLWQSLMGCYTPPTVRIGADDEVVLRVELNTSGDIANLPSILSPVAFSASERGLLREATSAIIDCTPIISGGGDKTIYGHFDVVINREGLTLTNVDAFVGKVDMVPTLDSLEIAEASPVLVEITENEETPPIEVSDESSPAEEAATGQPATLAIENELELTRTDRREIQRRLTLMDYGTRGVDGVFGNGSRTAIRQWQRDNDQPSSGYLDLNQLVLLRAMSQDKYDVWEARPKRYTDRNGCLREPNGTIVQGRSFKCDLSAASQSIGITR
jgi:hypothetical protein